MTQWIHAQKALNDTSLSKIKHQEEGKRTLKPLTWKLSRQAQKQGQISQVHQKHVIEAEKVRALLKKRTHEIRHRLKEQPKQADLERESQAPFQAAPTSYKFSQSNRPKPPHRPNHLAIQHHPIIENSSNILARFLAADIAFLINFDVSYEALKTAHEKAIKNKTEAHEELIASNKIDVETYYKYAAQFFKISYCPPNTLGKVALPRKTNLLSNIRNRTLVINRGKFGTNLIMAPDTKSIPMLHYTLQRDPRARKTIKIASPQTIRNAITNTFSASLLKHASNSLATIMPDISAKRVALPWQLALFCTCLIIFLSANLAGTAPWAIAIDSMLALFFLTCTSLRGLAALGVERNKATLKKFDLKQTDSLPIYTVLVPVYHEAAVMPDLIKSLKALDWPTAKLDIKILTEQDDHDTRNAALAATHGTLQFEVLTIPEGGPKTKPKALNFALPQARGAYVVIYDAEDRPNPKQLLEAYYTFQEKPHNYACLQAPLLIDNDEESWLARMFAIEYSALFDGFLPAVASWKLPLPLGGTSNHFKTHILRKVGAWDPHNVTEDADLGVRLKRWGYDAGVIDKPTFEEAPTHLSVWVKQRSRWFKGWMQTWLVHMRYPYRCWRELGTAGFLGHHIIMTGLILSALAHPFCLIFIGMNGIDIISNTPTTNMINTLMKINLIAAYLSYGFLCLKTLRYRDKGQHVAYIASLPLYWLLLSYAAWRALFQLFISPHQWEKTPHGASTARKNQAT